MTDHGLINSCDINARHYALRTSKEAKEKLKIQTEFNILGNEVKVKSKQAEKTLPGFIQKEKQQIYQKLEKTFALLPMWKEKANLLHDP